MHRKLLLFALILVLVGAAHLALAAPEDEKGESKESMEMKNRSTAPKDSDIVATATLESLLTKSGENDWSESKAASIEGYVVQVEKEEDGDYHLTLAANAGETDTKKWVVVEVTPAWASKDKNLSGEALHKLHGKHVRVTGWLFYEPEMDQKDPRGTRWEIHPVTQITTM